MRKLLLTLAVGIVVAGCSSPEDEHPQYWDIWKYRTSVLNDTQIATILTEAQEKHLDSLRETRQANEKIVAAERQAEAERKSAYDKEIAQIRASRPAECDNPIYRVRNLQECRRYDIAGFEYEPIQTERLKPVMPETLVEAAVMGNCMKTKTVKEAREAGCLPKEGGVSPRQNHNLR